MDPPRIFRLLRIAFSVVSGIACVLLIALWVRSYFIFDQMNWDRTNIRALSLRGQLGLTWLNRPTALSTRFQHTEFRSSRIVQGPNGTKVNYNDGTGYPLPSYPGFKSSWLSAPVRGRLTTFVIPYWFPVVVGGILAAALCSTDGPIPRCVGKCCLGNRSSQMG